MADTQQGLTLEQQVAALHVLKDMVEGEYKTRRAELLADLNEHNKDSRRPITSTSVEFDGIGDVAKITLPKEGDTFQIVDDLAFAAAVEEWHPDAIETIVRVKPDVARRILGNAQADGDQVVHVNKKTGEVNPLAGVQHVPARGKGEASKFTMTFTKAPDPHTPAPRDLLLDLMLAGGMAAEVLLGVEQQPSLNPAEPVEAELVDDVDAA